MITEDLIDSYYSVTGAVKDTVLFKVRSLEEFKTEKDSFVQQCTELSEDISTFIFSIFADALYAVPIQTAKNKLIGITYNPNNIPSSTEWLSFLSNIKSSLS